MQISLSLLMESVLLAELAVLLELDTIRIILLVLVRPVVTALAFRTCQRNVVAHLDTPLYIKISFQTSLI